MKELKVYIYGINKKVQYEAHTFRQQIKFCWHNVYSWKRNTAQEVKAENAAPQYPSQSNEHWKESTLSYPH